MSRNLRKPRLVTVQDVVDLVWIGRRAERAVIMRAVKRLHRYGPYGEWIDRGDVLALLAARKGRKG